MMINEKGKCLNNLCTMIPFREYKYTEDDLKGHVKLLMFPLGKEMIFWGEEVMVNFPISVNVLLNYLRKDSQNLWITCTKDREVC